jgi:hypothetical protein
MTTTSSPPVGWFPDPAGRHEHRYWDGSRWTEHVSDAGKTGTDALDSAAPAATAGASPANATAPAAAAGQVMPFQAIEFADISVSIEPLAARDAAAALLTARGFRIFLLDPWNGIAERGSKGMNVAFGALSQYYRVGFTVFTDPGGGTIVRLLRAPTGYWTGGGLIGKARVSGAFARITNELIDGFTQQGVLLGVRHA